jgi:AcrR family transcriptional regulator
MHNTNSVKLKEFENEKQYNILHTAKRLFLNQGYRKTTIRQIVKEAVPQPGIFIFISPIN